MNEQKHCPKCNHEQSAQHTECEMCGIIFAKYYQALENKPVAVKESGAPLTQEETVPSAKISSIFFYTKPEINKLYFYGRVILLIVIVLWGIRFMASSIESNYAGKSFMHMVNLPFHESGHILFRPFGRFMTSLGGTLGQFLMPIVCLFVLLIITRDTFGASVALWWVGQNFYDIAPYVNDARSLSLPLLGGNVGHSSPYGFHDWEYILKESGLIRYDHFLASSCITIGIIVFLVSFAWGGIILMKQYKTLSGH